MHVKPGCRPKHGVCARFAPSAVRWREFGLGRRWGRGWGGADATRVRFVRMKNESEKLAGLGAHHTGSAKKLLVVKGWHSVQNITADLF